MDLRQIVKYHSMMVPKGLWISLEGMNIFFKDFKNFFEWVRILISPENS